MKRTPFIHRIATKILATLTVVSTLAVIATGAVLVALSGRTLRSNISERNLQIARRASNEISLYIENSISDVKAAADVLAALKDPWIQDILLENLSMTFKRFQSIYLVTETGEVIASTHLDGKEVESFQPEELSPLEQEAHGFCLAVILWERGKTKEFWQQVLEFERQFPESSHLPSLQFIASGFPLQRRSRRAKVDRELLQEIVDYFPDSPEAYLSRRALSSM